jgi:uncharacterized membrane protein
MGSYGSAPGYGAPVQGPPPNNLVWAILVTILCCLPLGIVSIVYAARVDSKWAIGDAAGAYEASNKAKQWAIWGAAAAAIGVVLYLVFLFAVGASLSSSSDF